MSDELTLHDAAMRVVDAAEKLLPPDMGVIVITFHRQEETQVAIGASVHAAVAMEIIDHAAHSDVSVVSVEGHLVQPGTPVGGQKE